MADIPRIEGMRTCGCGQMYCTLMGKEIWNFYRSYGPIHFFFLQARDNGLQVCKPWTCGKFDARNWMQPDRGGPNHSSMGGGLVGHRWGQGS